MDDVKDYLKKLIKQDDVVVIGCSGGPDSICLFDILKNLQKEIDFSLICAHVNHNVRKESKNEQIFMEKYCLKNKIPFETMTITKYSDDNFENEARTIRYKYFDDLMKKYNGTYLMTAHHGDDLIETILMKIVRGSSISGYSGFSKEVDKSSYKIIRPLISVTKEDMLNYNKKHKLNYFIDKTNFDNFHTRNRYRKVVLPFLKKEDKNVHEKFLKYSKTLQMYNEYINKETTKIIKKVVKDNKLDIEKYKKLDDVIKNRVIYFMLEEKYSDDLILLNDKHVNIINNLIYSSRPNSYVYLPNNVKVVRSYNDLIIKEVTEEVDSYELEIGEKNSKVVLPNGKVIEVIEESEINDNNYARLNKEDLVFPLHIRTRKVGDKMYVKGMNKQKKVKDIFINSKIPLSKRDIWPIVVDSKDKVVWIPGIKKSKFDIPKNKKCDIILRYY